MAENLDWQLAESQRQVKALTEEVIKLNAGSDNLFAFAMTCQGLLARFTSTRVRHGFLNGDFRVPHNTADMLASLDTLRGRMLPSPHLFDGETDGTICNESLIFISDLLNRDMEPVEVDGNPLRHPMTNLECREYLNMLMQSQFWNEKIFEAELGAASYEPPIMGEMPPVVPQYDPSSSSVPGSGVANQDYNAPLPGSELVNQANAVGINHLPGSDLVNRAPTSDEQNLPGSGAAIQVKPRFRSRSLSFGSLAPPGVNSPFVQNASVPASGSAGASVTGPGGVPGMSGISTSSPPMVTLPANNPSGSSTAVISTAVGSGQVVRPTVTSSSAVGTLGQRTNPTTVASSRVHPPPVGAGIGGSVATGHNVPPPAPAVPSIMLPPYGAAHHGYGQYGTGCGPYGVQPIPPYSGWYPSGAAWTTQPTLMNPLGATGGPLQPMSGLSTFQPPPLATSGTYAGANPGGTVPQAVTAAAAPPVAGLGTAAGSANSQGADPLTQLLGQLRLNKEAVPPAKFDGTQSLPLSAFLKSYEKYYDSRYQDSDSGRSRKLGDFLAGGVKVMYDTLKGDTTRYSVLKPSLLALYTSMKSSETTKEKALTEFNTAHLRPGEPLLLYCTRLEQLGDQIFGSKTDRDCQLVARFRATAPPPVVEGIRDLERVLSVVGDGKVSWESVKKLAAADSRTLWRQVGKPTIGFPSSYSSSGLPLAGQSGWWQPATIGPTSPGARPSGQAAIEGVPTTAQAVQLGINDPVMAANEANNPLPSIVEGVVNQSTPNTGSGVPGRNQPHAAAARGATNAGNNRGGQNPGGRSRPNWANSNYCSWCGERSHNFAGCWARKGLCRYCGSADHQPSACPKFKDRFGQNLECPTCKGNHLGKDCPQASRNLN